MIELDTGARGMNIGLLTYAESMLYVSKLLFYASFVTVIMSTLGFFLYRFFRTWIDMRLVFLCMNFPRHE